MGQTFRPWIPEQTLLLPPSPVDWLPVNHLVFFLRDLSAELDLGEIIAYYCQKDPRGEKVYDPRMVVVLLLNANFVGFASDAVHLLQMQKRIAMQTVQQPGALIADAGYCSMANLEVCEQQGFEVYISTSRQPHGHRSRPSRGRAPRDLDPRGRMERKLRSLTGQTIYALRKTIVEPVFGQIKGARGLNRFRLRGLEKVNGEWALIVTTHNLLKLFRATVAMT